ncbi:MAG: hypothetical protein ACI4TI_02615 [Christensenellales bacterium]
MEKEDYNKKLNKALVKRALGYLNKEVTEEFCKEDEGKMVLTKRKVTKKNIPPDIMAVKVLLEMYSDNKDLNFENLSDKELLIERDKLIEKLKENNEI